MNTDELSLELRAGLERLATLPSRPAAEHLEVFEEVHRLLEDSLQDLAGIPGAPGPVGARAPR